MKIKDRAKPKTPPVEPGVYIAICIGVVDLGEQYSEKFKNYANKVKFIWELVGETIEVDGEQKPRQLSKEFTFSISKSASERSADLIRSVKLTDARIARILPVSTNLRVETVRCGNLQSSEGQVEIIRRLSHKKRPSTKSDRIGSLEALTRKPFCAAAR